VTSEPADPPEADPEQHRLESGVVVRIAERARRPNVFRLLAEQSVEVGEPARDPESTPQGAEQQEHEGETRSGFRIPRQAKGETEYGKDREP
jgi:hypothetical protein